jgi:hypothetical protein
MDNFQKKQEEIRNHLREMGYSEEEIEVKLVDFNEHPLIDEWNDESIEQNQIKAIQTYKWKRKPILLFIAIVLMLISCLIPSWIFDQYQVFITLIPSFIASIYFYLWFCKYNSIGELYTGQVYDEELESYRNSLSRWGYYLAFFCFILFMALTININSTRLEKKFDETGKVAKAELLDKMFELKSGVVSKKAQRFNVGLQFSTETGKQIVQNKLLEIEQFEKLIEVDYVPVLYLPEHPEVVKILISNNDIKKYLGVNQRALNALDLQNMLYLQTDSIIVSILNKININWQLKSFPNESEFTNWTGDEKIIIKKGKIIYLTTKDVKTFNFLANLNFERIQDKSDKIKKIIGGEKSIVYTPKSTITIEKRFNFTEKKWRDISTGEDITLPITIGSISSNLRSQMSEIFVAQIIKK